MGLSDYRIAELTCGKGRLGIAPMPGRAGSYDADLTAILRWDPGLVLTMTTGGELVRSGALDLGADLETAGVVWRHLPIPDFGAPPPATDAQWPDVSVLAHGLLGEGRGILAHCYGGCGRSGMALLRLMVEAGEDLDPALLRLRDVRPCAVETEQQKAWAAIPLYERYGWSR